MQDQGQKGVGKGRKTLPDRHADGCVACPGNLAYRVDAMEKFILTVRHRTQGTDFPPFSARNFRDLSGSAVAGSSPPEGFADAALPAKGATLAECVYLSGLLQPPALCSGIGRCGLCRVRFLSAPPPVFECETAVLSHHDLDGGWRLACRHAPEPGAHILVPGLPLPEGDHEQQAPGTVREGRFGLAVDLGTTSVHWRLVPLDHADGREAFPDGAPRGIMTNPQMGAGSDVISRLAHAGRAGGTETLRSLAVRALASIVRACANSGCRVGEICVAANPAMTGILLGLDTECLAHAPYSLPLEGNVEEAIPGLPPVYIPSMISPFVGGDVSAGYAALALNPDLPAPEFPFLLADLGTNGECVLALSPTEALAASLPMGPALEGVNLTFGSEAVPGAVTEYRLTPRGIEPVVMGETAPTGVTATGYLSLLRILRASNVLTEDGLFTGNADASRLSRTAGENIADAAGPGIRLPGKMVLYAADVEEILKVKAAFTLAVSRLLRVSSLPASRLSRVFLAGSLGANVSLAALAGLGFLPSGIAAADKVVLAGNTSLAGAELFLRNKTTRAACAAWAGSVVTLDLASDASFGEEFARHMVFAWRA